MEYAILGLLILVIILLIILLLRKNDNSEIRKSIRAYNLICLYCSKKGLLWSDMIKVDKSKKTSVYFFLC